MGSNKKYIVTVIIGLVLLSGSLEASIGANGTILLPGIIYKAGHDGECGASCDKRPFPFPRSDMHYIAYLYQVLGDLLIKNNARIEINSYMCYDYVLLINGKEVTHITANKILNKEECTHRGGLETPSEEKEFFQYVIDDVLRRLDQSRKDIRAQKGVLPKEGFTIQLGVFGSKRPAVRLAKRTDNDFFSYIDSSSDPDAAAGHLFCHTCIAQAGGGESGYGQFPNIFFYMKANKMWAASYGLFVNRKDAKDETGGLKKFYKGPFGVEKITIDQGIIDKQTMDID